MEDLPGYDTSGSDSGGYLDDYFGGGDFGDF
jgi:hypothetical protein